MIFFSGDGTGGESIWGGEFEDEFHRNLRHDRPYTISMANAWPNTSSSQFFITVVPTVRKPFSIFHLRRIRLFGFSFSRAKGTIGVRPLVEVRLCFIKKKTSYSEKKTDKTIKNTIIGVVPTGVEPVTLRRETSVDCVQKVLRPFPVGKNIFPLRPIRVNDWSIFFCF